jgi:ADP-ribose pyrophosphatase YjhB (NUDIX family)
MAVYHLWIMDPTDRKFALFPKPITPGGLCLSVFVVLSKDRESNVLMGKMNTEYPKWRHIGGLERDRLQRYSAGWVLPSRVLIQLESPQDAARTVLKEQVGLDRVELTGPKMITEVWDTPDNKNHWDFEFIFTGKITGEVQPHPAWKELRFIDVSSLPDSEFARYHNDILVYAGARSSFR